MGELNKKIGDKLENFGGILFQNLGWDLLAQNLEISCINKNHKNHKNNDKKTHGIDLLFKYNNPFNNRKEAIIVECKNRQWKEFTPANLNLWTEELLNTVECASISSEVSSYIQDCTLIGGILLFNSSDEIYTKDKARKNLAQINIPKRKSPLMLYIADTNMLEKWYSLNTIIDKIKKDNINNFRIIYPSINESEWTPDSTIIPSFLFSDYIISSYMKELVLIPGQKNLVEHKTIFVFEKVSLEAVQYLKSMINTLQLAFHVTNYKFIIYWYPEDKQDVDIINNLNNSAEDLYTFIPMDNRSIQRIEYGS